MCKTQIVKDCDKKKTRVLLRLRCLFGWRPSLSCSRCPLPGIRHVNSLMKLRHHALDFGKSAKRNARDG